MVALNVDQRDTQIGAFLPAQMHHALGDRHLERGLNGSGQEVAATERAVLQTKHCMKMKAGFAVITLCHVTDQA